MELINIEDIIPNTRQPRKTFYEETLGELAQSIQERGVLEPIIVRPKGDKYEIVMGERRYRAGKLAGLTTIPAIVRDMTDQDAAADGLLENFQREDLNPIDRAKAIEALLNFMTWDKCAKTLGVSESTLRRHLDLLELPPFVQEELIQSWNRTGPGCFAEAHARLLKVLNADPDIQRRVIEKIKTESLSVSETQRLLDAIREVPAKIEAFLRVPLKVTEEILKQIGKSREKMRPFKARTAEQHMKALEKTARQLGYLIDDRLIDFLKGPEMNQVLSACTSLADELGGFCQKLKISLQKGDDGFKEVYIHCPLCGRIELIGGLRCGVCWTILRRCLDCGHYDKTYQRCSLTEGYVYLSEAESPKENSKSYKCADYKPKFETRKAA